MDSNADRLYGEYKCSFERFPREYMFNGNRYALFDRPRVTSDPYDEGNLVPHLVANAYRATAWFSLLMPEYHKNMPFDSGVLFYTSVPSNMLSTHLSFPGDIDLLAIPYEGCDLVLSRALAIEVKVIRVSYANQKKSPNRFGFSQAMALAEFGFPYVAVAHLVVSDRSPESEFVEYISVKLVDDQIGEMCPVRADPLPIRLTDRAFGRLEANARDCRIGLFAECMHGEGVYLPCGRPCGYFGYTKECVTSLAQFYNKETDMFFRLPRYAPEEAR